MILETKVLTTFGATGKELYGNNFIKSFLSNWPSDIKLTVYAEDWSEDLPNVEILDIDREVPEINEFIRHCSDEISQLEKKDRNSKRINWYNKAIRWSFKSLVIRKELMRKDRRYLIWLDGDVTSLGTPPMNLAGALLNGASFASQMERVKGMPHCETGIIAFDTHHQECARIIEHIAEGYIENKVLELEKPWDGFWFAELVKRGVSFTDLNRERSAGKKTFNNKHIYRILEHNVGNRKLKENGLHAITGRKINESW